MTLLHSDLTDGALGAFCLVYKDLGFGFLEGAYANALSVELRFRGFQVEREVVTEVVYRGVVVGRYRVDMVVNDRLLIEIKSTRTITEADERQVLNYLKATKRRSRASASFRTQASIPKADLHE